MANDMPVIWFPNLGIEICKLNKIAFSIFGFEIYMYSICIMLGMILAITICLRLAKKNGMDTKLLFDAVLYGYIFGIAGARLYYVVFQWSYYSNNIFKVFNLRDGGLAIYGGIIGAQIAVIFFSKKNKMNYFELADLSAIGFPIAQAFGRWGNFFNREAYGGYTDNLFAMRILKEDAQKITSQLMENLITINNTQYIQVHPTFLYESIWNIINFTILYIYYKNKKFNGEIFALYILIYGIGRFFIEGLRQDQLLLWGTNVAVSQALSLLFVLLSLVFLLIKRRALQSKK